MKAFLISLVFALSLSGCAVNVYYLPPVNDQAPVVPNITVDIVNPATPAPEPFVVEVPGPERVVKQKVVPDAIAEFDALPKVDKEMYRRNDDEYGYVKALERQAENIRKLIDQVKFEKAQSDDNNG